MESRWTSTPALIEGIGQATADKLQACGVESVVDLLYLNPERVHGKDSTLSREGLQSWRDAAWLLLVDDISPDIAECFVAGGIRSLDELAESGLRTVENALKDGQEAGRISDIPSLYKIAEIQRKAESLSGTAIVSGVIKDNESGEPIAGARVSSGRARDESGADGRFLLDRVEEGLSVVRVRSEGHRRAVVTLPARSGKATGPVDFRLVTRPPAEGVEVSLSERDGAQLGHSGATEVEWAWSDLNELPQGSYLLYRSDYVRSEHARLLNIHRRREGRKLIHERVKVERSLLPEGASVGDILHWDGNALAVSPKSLREVHLEHFQNQFHGAGLTYLRTKHQGLRALTH